MPLLGWLLAPVATACGHDEEVEAWADEEEAADAPSATVASDDEDDARRDDVMLSYDTQFLPEMPGHHLALRLVGKRDAYVGGEIRYTPTSDLVGSGRVGAGLDLFGGGNFDLTVGLWIGAAGEWDRHRDLAVLYATPILGTEVGLGIEGRHLFVKYRWLAGFGAEPIDAMLTENELTFGYKVVPQLHLYGQYLVLSPGEHDDEAGVGLGAKLVF